MLQGEAKKLQSDNGVLEHSLQTLSVITTPADIPTHITVEISNLAVGDVVRVGDLVLPPGVTISVDPDTPVVVAAGAAVEEAPVAEEAEGEGEGDEAGAAEGGADDNE